MFYYNSTRFGCSLASAYPVPELSQSRRFSISVPLFPRGFVDNRGILLYGDQGISATKTIVRRAASTHGNLRQAKRKTPQAVFNPPLASRCDGEKKNV